MKVIICLVALACAASSVSCLTKFYDYPEIYETSEILFRTPKGIKEELNKKEMSPEETVLLLSEEMTFENLFDEYAASDILMLNYVNEYQCNDLELKERGKLCDKIDDLAANDDSLMFKNLLNCCRDLNSQVADFCADKMNKYDMEDEPLMPEFNVFPPPSAESPVSMDVLKNWLSESDSYKRANLIAEYLWRAENKATKIFGDLTIGDFLTFNQFKVDRCEPEALHESAKFVQSLAPKVANGKDFDMESEIEKALLFFSRRVLQTVVDICVQLQDTAMKKQSDEFKSELENAVDKNEVMVSLGELAKAAKFDPTPLEKFLLELEPVPVVDA